MPPNHAKCTPFPTFNAGKLRRSARPRRSWTMRTPTPSAVRHTQTLNIRAVTEKTAPRRARRCFRLQARGALLVRGSHGVVLPAQGAPACPPPPHRDPPHARPCLLRAPARARSRTLASVRALRAHPCAPSPTAPPTHHATAPRRALHAPDRVGAPVLRHGAGARQCANAIKRHPDPLDHALPTPCQIRSAWASPARATTRG